MATVIYTHTLDPHIAVVWSGFFNFLGVVSSTGIVAFGIISLLPVELILQVGSNAGFAMVFALLVAAILLEPRHLVFRIAGFEFAHPHRLDHWRRHHQSVDERAQRNQRRGLGPSG